VSYGQGLFGWQEAGFRPIVELTVIFELAAVVLLSAALAAAASSPARLSTGCFTTSQRWSVHGDADWAQR
jgi:hypothetical protein